MPTRGFNVLVIAAREDSCRDACNHLRVTGYRVEGVATVEEGMTLLKDGAFGAVLLYVEGSAAAGAVGTIKALKRVSSDLRIMVVTDEPSQQVATNYILAGADDYLVSPVRYPELERRIQGLFTLDFSDPLAPRRQTEAGPVQDFGPYEVLHRLAFNGMESTYLVERQGLRYELSILERRDEPDHAYDGRRQRFMRGAVVANAIDHPHLIRVVDVFIGDRVHAPYFVTDHLEGERLAAYVEGHPEVGFKGRARMIRQLADALAALHAHHMVLRSITPQGVLVTPGGMPKIVDFHFAHVPSSHLTHAGDILGIPEYLAPECALTTSIGPAADVFSLGCVAYELMVGAKPFAGLSVAEVLEQLRSARPKRPCKRVEDFPRPLEDILAKMLRKDPKDRYPAMGPLIEDLDAFLAGEPPPIAGKHGLTEALFVRVWS